MNKHSLIFLFLSLGATVTINNLPAFAKTILTNPIMKKPSEQSNQLSQFISPSILDGKYLSEQNLFEVTLQVQSNQFRLQEAGYPAEQWQSISKLQYVRSGIVYFDGFYWCSEQAPRLPQNTEKPISIYQGISRACTANGWVEK